MSVVTESPTFEADVLEALANTHAVYSGTHGCACGCRGNHTDSSRSVKIITGKIRRALLDPANEDEITISRGKFNPYVSLDTETRVLIAYYTPKEV